MLYIVRVYEEDMVHEYEYGLPEHAREHLHWEKSPAELYVYRSGEETLMETNEQKKSHHPGR
ncbi:MAG: hypothetical protein IJE07_06365 [Clostridia bacterium]|nr:hypothetical protein [Clostridia bacterium]